MWKNYFQITVYIPDSHVESVKDAMFNAGGGKVGHYERCSWETKGVGQFVPLVGSQPAIGTHHQLECVPEYKVEMVCQRKYLSQVIKALLKAHPYEEPGYQVHKIKTLVQLTKE